MDSSLHCFFLQVGAALGAARVAGIALSLRHAVLNFFLGIIPSNTVRTYVILKMIYIGFVIFTN